MGIIDRLLMGNENITQRETTIEDYQKLSPELDFLQKSLTQTKGQSNTNFVSGLDMGTFDYTSDTKNTNKGKIKENSPQVILNQKALENQWANTIIVQAIIRTRINQVSSYLRPASISSTGLGYRIVPKDGSLVTTTQKINRVKYLENFIQNTGSEITPQRDTFVEFIKKFIYDLYTYDQINVELAKRGEKIDHFNILDAGSILIKEVPKSIDKPRVFAQYSKDGKELATFKENELTFYVTNPRTDMSLKGYGNSAVQAVIQHLQYYRDTEGFNAKFFEQGGTTKGILLINYGDANASTSQASLQALRQQWSASFAGTSGAWKIPVMAGQDAKFINMSQSSKDMEFEKWLNYLLNIICSVFTIAPEEVNFPNRGGTTGKTGGSTLNEGNTMKSKMDNSKQKGLQPLLQSIEDFMNRYVLSNIDSDYVFQFTVGDSISEKEKLEVLNLKLKNGLTINEARKEMGYGEAPTLEKAMGAMGDIIGDAGTAQNILTLLANIQMNQQAQQLAETTSANNSNSNPNMTTNEKSKQGDTTDLIQQKNNADASALKNKHDIKDHAIETPNK